jgi:hydroxymethyl cephem carbamoyltransferase
LEDAAVRVLALNLGHDGAAAVLSDRRLLCSLEAEKDSVRRHARINPMTLLSSAQLMDGDPDVIAFGGWGHDRLRQKFDLAMFNLRLADYEDPITVEHGETRLFGKPVTAFTSSHERSHIMMAVGMAPREDAPMRAVLVWEGAIGSLYLLDSQFTVTRSIPVLRRPGQRYAFLFALADQSVADQGEVPQPEYAGKLMALAAYGDAHEADERIRDTVERILTEPNEKRAFADSPVYNSGVESEACKTAAALLTDRMFEIFSDAARAELPPGLPLHISGGCGLNCDWNVRWRELGHFSSVFVPPCTNDAGSAIGTAIDALHFTTGDPHIDWSVYSGREFEWDSEPDPDIWRRRALDADAVAQALAEGQVFAWVQGRWEIGPRALGNRSILAEPFHAQTRERLNEIKQRERYRPIAPCCRVEDLGLVFNETFEDPYMLYFRTLKSERHQAVAHVDGSARCQTVSGDGNPPLHRLLTAFSGGNGAGVLCNTSLNFKGTGFINRMTDLTRYCEERGIDAIVVGNAWFERVRPLQPAGRRRGGQA